MTGYRLTMDRTALNPALASLCPNAVSAATYNANGGNFADDHQATFTVSDANSLRAMEVTLRVFGRLAKAIRLAPLGDVAFNCEVVFDGTEAVAFYNGLPEQMTDAVYDRLAQHHPALTR